jgi:hypothetical protein
VFDEDIDETPPHAWGGARERRAVVGGRGDTPTCVGRRVSTAPRASDIARHPHMRGAEWERRESAETMCEAPPPMWGGGHPRAPRGHLQRVTPTCVARGGRARIRCAMSASHPHACGAELSSSPSDVGDVTPTCVGRRTAARASGPVLQRHPHGCGAEFEFEVQPLREYEPLPRGWDGGLADAECVEEARGTPTGVERSAVTRRRSARCARHPHKRGAEGSSRKTPLNVDEAHPRLWGGDGGRSRYHGRCRATPTRVGQRLRGPAVCTCQESHPHDGGGSVACIAQPSSRKSRPHACGAEVSIDVVTGIQPESPPRAWDGATSRVRMTSGSRVTPTRVGRSWSPVTTPRHLPSHPHMRGAELGVSSAAGWIARHPHMRGAEAASARTVSCGRETPPHAWGGDQSSVSGLLAAGDTPTGVGRGRHPRRASGSPPSHPHGCGAELFARRQHPRLGETPPHAWGGDKLLRRR